MKIDFAVGAGRNERIWEIPGIARAAEDSGFTYLTFLDSQNFSRDVYVMLTVAAVNTSRIKLGQAVTIPITRHPSVTANAIATIDKLSGGRAFVGLGAGGSAASAIGERPATLNQLRQTIRFIREFTAGNEAEYQGTRMRSEWINRPLKIYVGGGGPRLLELAGEIADGIILSSNFGVNPIAMQWKLEQIQRGAEKAGRSLKDLDIWARTVMYVSRSREGARREASGYAVNSALSTVAQFKGSNKGTEELKKRLLGAYPWLLDDCRKVADVYEPHMHEQPNSPAAQAVTQCLIDVYHMVGSPGDICDKVNAIGRLGVNVITTNMSSILDKKGMIRAIGAEVIPRFLS